MTHYKVTLEIEVNADSPLEAAKTVQGWLRSDDYQYYVQEDEVDGKIVSVDLTEADEDAVLPADDYTPLIS